VREPLRTCFYRAGLAKGLRWKARKDMVHDQGLCVPGDGSHLAFCTNGHLQDGREIFRRARGLWPERATTSGANNNKGRGSDSLVLGPPIALGLLENSKPPVVNRFGFLATKQKPIGLPKNRGGAAPKQNPLVRGCFFVAGPLRSMFFGERRRGMFFSIRDQYRPYSSYFELDGAYFRKPYRGPATKRIPAGSKSRTPPPSPQRQRGARRGGQGPSAFDDGARDAAPEEIEPRG